MAEADFVPEAGAAQMRGAINIAGALVSIALLAGIGVWGYKLMVRDVSGVPVVRAIEGPMRVQPSDPGGRPADHQGLAVNAVAAHGEAAPTPDELVLAPRPVTLESEDATAGELAETLVKVTAEASPPPASEEPAPISDAALDEFQAGSVAALVEELTEGIEPLADSDEDVAVLVPEETPAAEAETAEDPPVVPVLSTNVPGVKRSLRPPMRPADLAPPDRNAQEIAATQPSAVRDVNPDDIAAGTRLAQLGAYESADIAKGEWDKLAGRFSDYMNGKDRVVQKASSGGRTFYRLRVMGFADLSDARRFCSALVAEGADCIPVVSR